MMVPATFLGMRKFLEILWKVHLVPELSFDFSCEADSLHLIGTYPGTSYQWGTQCLESRPGACAS